MDAKLNERFAIAQGMYSHLAQMMSTRTSDNLRGELDAEIEDAWRETGGTSYPLKIGGETVGTMTVQTMDGYSVVDKSAFDEWLRETGIVEECEIVNPSFDWQQWAINDPEYYEKRQWIRDNMPGFFIMSDEYMTDWHDCVIHRGDVVIDRDTGEELPFLTYTTRFVGTKVTGCKWSNAPKKYMDVADAVRSRSLESGGIDALLGE